MEHGDESGVQLSVGIEMEAYTITTAYIPSAKHPPLMGACNITCTILYSSKKNQACSKLHIKSF